MEMPCSCPICGRTMQTKLISTPGGIRSQWFCVCGYDSCDPRWEQGKISQSDQRMTERLETNSCRFLEPDKFGNICHQEEEQECPEPDICTAQYDIHGRTLVN